MKIDVRALGYSFALLWGGAVFITGSANLIWPTYGTGFLEVLASVYPGYQGTASFGQVLVGTLSGLVDGFPGRAGIGLALQSICEIEMAEGNSSDRGEHNYREGAIVPIWRAEFPSGAP